MPQPFKTAVGDMAAGRGGNVDFAATAIDKRPALRDVLVQIIFLWARVEQTLALSLAHTLHTQPEVGVEVYLSLEHNAAQLKVVRETAALVLNDADTALFDAILTLVRDGGKKRNLVAHGIWGVADQVPNGLLLLQSRDFARFHGPMMARIGFDSEKMQDKMEANKQFLEAAPTRLFEILNKTQVYFDWEFAEMKDAIASANNSVADFWIMHQKPVGAERDQLRRKLCETPAVQEVLFRQPRD